MSILISAFALFERLKTLHNIAVCQRCILWALEGVPIRPYFLELDHNI
jgi:hypothetical protein